MFAIINGQSAVVEEYLTNRNSKNTVSFATDVIRETRQTVPHLLLQFCPAVHPKFLLKRKDLTREVINALDWQVRFSVMCSQCFWNCPSFWVTVQCIIW